MIATNTKMAIEIEKKYKLKIQDYEQIVSVLSKPETGAEFLSEDFEINEIYSGGVLESKKAVLRIRKIGEKTILTYKQRLETNSAIKRQIEHETEVAGAEAIENIIESLGFEKKLVYEKRRQTWRLDDVEVALDELPFGRFMEIEGSAPDIERVEQLISREKIEAEHATYPELTAKLGSKNGQAIEARFE